MAYIDIIDPTGKDFRYLLPEDGSVIVIGADASCPIALPELPDLQPQHAIISLQQEGYVLSAAPGATIMAEGTPIDAVMLVPHAVYNVGAAMLMFNDAALESMEGVIVPQPVQMQAEMPMYEEMPGITAQEEAPVEEEAGEEPEDEPARKPKKKARTPKGGSLLSTAIYTIEDSALHIIIRRLYVIAILALAFLAGLTMRCWMSTGKYLIDELLK